MATATATGLVTGPILDNLRIRRALAMKARIDSIRAALPADVAAQFTDDFAAADAVMTGVDSSGKIDPANLDAILKFLTALLAALLPLLIPHA